MNDAPTDTELSAWYGFGLHAEKARRLIDEVRRLRLALAGETELRVTFQAEAGRAEESIAAVRVVLDEYTPPQPADEDRFDHGVDAAKQAIELALEGR